MQFFALYLSDRIALELARHPDFPRTFTRSRKLPLSALIRALDGRPIQADAIQKPKSR